LPLKQFWSSGGAGLLKEAEFLNVPEHINAITKAEAKEIAGCLDWRNTAQGAFQLAHFH
jgi:hypothetical protein